MLPLLIFAGLEIKNYMVNPLITFPQAAHIYVQNYKIAFFLTVAEFIRQLHFYAAENIKTYWGLWVRGSSKFHKRFSGFKPTTKIQLSKGSRVAFVLLITAMLISYATGTPMTGIPGFVVVSIKKLISGVITQFTDANQLTQLFTIGGIFILQFVAMFWFMAKGGYEIHYPEDIQTRFKDVWGQDHVMNRVREVVDHLENPEEIEAHGGDVPGGILLWGPPGTGKTLMAEAIAGETGKPFIFVEPGAFQAMFVGVGNMKVRALYKKIRKLAVQHDGVIVFYDEADSLGNRGGMVSAQTPLSDDFKAITSCHALSYIHQDTSKLILNDVNKVVTGMPMNGGGGNASGLQALLTEMNGLKKPRGFFNRFVRRALGMKPLQPPKYRVLTIMATNMPDSLDPALLRPGRIDRLFRVGYPSLEGRIMTFQNYLKKVKHELTEDQIIRLATSAQQATGATIKDMVNEALITSLRDGRTVVTWDDMVKAKRYKDYGPSENVEYVNRERHAVAIHEASHAVAAFLLRKRLQIDTATIEKGADFLGLVSSIQTEELYTRWKSDYEADICVAIASLAGERYFFNSDSTSGVSGDLQTATRVAVMMETSWGMGDTYSVSNVMSDAQVGLAKGNGPKPVPERIEKRLEELYQKTYKMLVANRKMVLSLAHALENNKTINGADVEAILRFEKGELVDGSVYAPKAATEKIEKYHQQVLAAHAKGESLRVALPDLSEFSIDKLANSSTAKKKISLSPKKVSKVSEVLPIKKEPTSKNNNK